jgi:hypothetical protein
MNRSVAEAERGQEIFLRSALDTIIATTLAHAMPSSDSGDAVRRGKFYAETQQLSERSYAAVLSPQSPVVDRSDDAGRKCPPAEASQLGGGAA